MKFQIEKISIFSATYKFLRESINFFLAIHLLAIGMSGGQLGTLFATSTIAGIITILPSGFINDRIKSKHAVITALLMMSIFYFSLSQTTNFLYLLPMFLIGGMGKSLFTTSIDSLFYKSTQRQKAYKQVATLLIPNYIMIGLGLITAGYLLNINVPFESIFKTISIAMLTMALIGSAILPDSATAHFSALHYRKDFFQRKIVMLAIILFFFAIHFGAEETAYGLFLKHNLGLNTQEMGLYMGSAIIVMAISIKLISTIFHRINTASLLIFGTFISGLFHILMALVTTPEISWIFRVIHEIGDSALFFFLIYGISQFFDLKRIGGNASLFTFIIIIGGTIGAAIFGPMGVNYGYHIPLIVSGTTSLIAFILSLKFMFDYESDFNRNAR